jgi:hypothetical protein
MAIGAVANCMVPSLFPWFGAFFNVSRARNSQDIKPDSFRIRNVSGVRRSWQRSARTNIARSI